MTEKQFDNVYKHKGGIQKLLTLFNDGETHETIGLYFGVGRWAVSLWCQKFFGGIDPRTLRRTKRLNELYYELTLLGNINEFNKKFASENRHYRKAVIKKYKEALLYANKS